MEPSPMCLSGAASASIGVPSDTEHSPISLSASSSSAMIDGRSEKEHSPSAADALSDDSGVDVKPRLLADVPPTQQQQQQRNKRKSSEPKKRRDVLLMKRFRWEDTEDEDEDNNRPSSGDSGCVAPHHTPPSSRQSVIIRQKETRQQDSSSPSAGARPEVPPSRPHARNYKSMSRQRRIEANARERTRVHTISAAFESLRRAVPAYAHNQKLSKLAILRIASAYIVALACLNQDQHQGPTEMSECVEQCTRTIQAEGRSRRRTAKD